MNNKYGECLTLVEITGVIFVLKGRWLYGKNYFPV